VLGTVRPFKLRMVGIGIKEIQPLTGDVLIKSFQKCQNVKANKCNRRALVTSFTGDEHILLL